MNSQSFLSLWYVRTLAIIILIAIATALIAYTKLTWRESVYGQYGVPVISVRGEGEVLAKPDIGTFSFSVQAEGDDAATAQSSSAEKINAILAFLKESGVEDKDVKTSGYYLNPKYRYETTVCAANSYCPPSNPILDGYEVTESVTVKVRDIDQSGTLISGVGERGATNISGLSFTIDDDSAIKDEARAAAIADAKERAKTIAKEMGVSLGRITAYYEESDYMPYGYGGSNEALMSARADAAAVPSLPTGENMTRSVVNVSFEIR